mgnify:CR=1 FL=1
MKMENKKINLNFSSDGIDILNDIEQQKNTTDKHNKSYTLSTREKLNKLIRKYPYKRFYKSLKSQIDKKIRLSKKQVEIINTSYQERFEN